MFNFKDKTCVITGASAGIGAEFARQLAARGANLVLVARSAGRLQALARSLADAHGVRVEAVAEDLSRPGAARRVRQAISRPVDVLINNAGFGTYGGFAELPLERQREELDLNIGALVELTHVFLPDLERAKGGVIQVSSTAAFQPVPFMAVYAASKAFVLSFSEALWGEYRDRGVRVLALCPGATATEFFDIVGSEDAAVGKKASPAEVVREGLAAFAKDRSHVIHGWANYFTAQTSRFTPRATAVNITRKVMKPKALPPPATRAPADPLTR